mgnify:CR=1 FL=1
MPEDKSRPSTGQEKSVRDLRNALGGFVTGVTVVTTEIDGERCGFTANSFCSVSLDPPLVLWSIRRESTCFDVFAGCTHFAVNVLSAGQIALSRRFAQTGPGRFRDLTWRDGAGGAPVLEGVVASFQCRTHCTYDGGDPLILVGEVLGCDRHAGQPLLYSRGRYAVAVEHPDTGGLEPPDDPRGTAASE